MHANQGDDDANARFTETAKIMHAVYQQNQQVTLKPKATVKIKTGQTTTTTAKTKQALTYWVPKGQKATYKLRLKTTLAAPTKAQTKAGVAEVTLPAQTRQFLKGSTGTKVPVYTQKAVKKASIGQQINRLWQHLF